MFTIKSKKLNTCLNTEQSDSLMMGSMCWHSAAVLRFLSLKIYATLIALAHPKKLEMINYKALVKNVLNS